jgi:hypothetical protein
MTDQTKTKTLNPVMLVERVEQLAGNELNDLCDATDAAIEGGGGFGWLHVTRIATMLERYWQGVVAMRRRVWLLVARLDGVICGTSPVMWMPPTNNEAQGHIVQPDHELRRAVGARARARENAGGKGRGTCASEEGFAVINLDVRCHDGARDRDCMKVHGLCAASAMHPYSVRLENQILKGYYYYKVIDPKAVEQQI